MKNHKLRNVDVHGRRTAAEGAIQHNFAYGVGSSIVGVIPGPRLAVKYHIRPRLDYLCVWVHGFTVNNTHTNTGPRLSVKTCRGVCVMFW